MAPNGFQSARGREKKRSGREMALILHEGKRGKKKTRRTINDSPDPAGRKEGGPGLSLLLVVEGRSTLSPITLTPDWEKSYMGQGYYLPTLAPFKREEGKKKKAKLIVPVEPKKKE